MDRDDKQKQLIIDYQGTFGTEEGKRVLGRISRLCRENEPSFVDHNTHYTAYNEGKRCIMLHIRKMLGKSPHDEKQLKAKE